MQSRQELPPPSTPQSDPRTSRYSGLGWEGPGGKSLLIPTSTLTTTVEELSAQECSQIPACSPSRTFSSVKTPVSWGAHSQQGPGPEARPLAGYIPAPTYPAERDPVLLEDNGRDEGHLVPKEGIAALGASGEEAWSRRDSVSQMGRGGQAALSSSGPTGTKYPGACQAECTHVQHHICDYRQGVRWGHSCPQTAPDSELPSGASTRSLGHVRGQPGDRTEELLSRA